MDLALYQIIVPFLCFLLIAKAFSNYFRGKKTIRELIALSIFWLIVALIAIFPFLTEKLAFILGIKSNVNAVVFTSLGILSYICFRLLIVSENQEQELTRLTRALALRDFREKK